MQNQNTFYKIFIINLQKKIFPVTVLRLYQAYGPGQDLNRLIPIVINSCLKKEKFPCSEENSLEILFMFRCN